MVFIDAAFQGEPRNDIFNPTLTMPRWSSAVVYLLSTTGPIVSVDFATPFPTGQARGIFGRLGQRWTSSHANGIYDQTTPGPTTVDNGGGDLGLDSHFLGTSSNRLFTIPPTEGNVLFPGANPLPGSPTIG